MPGAPLKNMFPIGLCGARTRKGNPCRIRMVFKSMRCKFHGGMSTGPKTPEGKAKVTQNLRLTPNWKRRSIAQGKK